MKKLLSALILVASVSYLPLAQADTVSNDSTETTGQYMDASAVTAKVKSALLTKKNVDSNSISVQSETASGDKTIVILTGTQKSQALIDLAVATTRNVKGVSKVVNKLTVAP